MAVRIRLKRMGKIRAPFYRVVVMDSRTKRDGRAIEEIGKYHPTREPSLIEIDLERADYWLSHGAQPTEAVAALLKKCTDGTVRTAEPKPGKKELYEAALSAAGKTLEDVSGATTPRRRSAKPSGEAEPAGAAAETGTAAGETEAAAADEAPATTAAAEG